QPQVEVAFGFLIVNPPPVTVSTKSTSAPLRYRMLMGSTKSVTPFDWNTWSPPPPFSSIISPYWKPEHPPPCTNTRRPLFSFCSSARSSVILEAAAENTLIISMLLERQILLWKLYNTGLA